MISSGQICNSLFEEAKKKIHNYEHNIAKSMLEVGIPVAVNENWFSAFEDFSLQGNVWDWHEILSNTIANQIKKAKNIQHPIFKFSDMIWSLVLWRIS